MGRLQYAGILSLVFGTVISLGLLGSKGSLCTPDALEKCRSTRWREHDSSMSPHFINPQLIPTRTRIGISFLLFPIVWLNAGVIEDFITRCYVLRNTPQPWLLPKSKCRDVKGAWYKGK